MQTAKENESLEARDERKARARANHAAWRSRNREKHSASGKRWKLENPDKVAAAAARRYKREKEKIAAANEKWRKENKERMLATRREWYRRNAEKERIRHKKYMKKNPDKNAIYLQNRRARKLANGGSLAPGIVKKLYTLQRGCCAICRMKLVTWEIDHVSPLAAGGRNDDKNVQLLCRPCNASKHIKDPIAFMQSRGYLL